MSPHIHKFDDFYHTYSRSCRAAKILRNTSKVVNLTVAKNAAVFYGLSHILPPSPRHRRKRNGETLLCITSPAESILLIFAGHVRQREFFCILLDMSGREYFAGHVRQRMYFARYVQQIEFCWTPFIL